jgi:cytoskeletal protein CcmA (bactofilin family)
LLSEDVEIIGTITFSDNLTIEGKVLGDVISKGDLTIGENAFVKGNIEARTASVHGRVEGNINVQGRCEAGATASIVGDVAALTFSIQEGATLMGRSRIGKTAVTAAGAAAPAAVQAKR